MNADRTLTWARTGLLIGMALAACSASNDRKTPESSEAPAATPAAAAQGPKDPRIEEWRKVVAKTPAPKEGCFTVTYPSTTWSEEACAPATSNPLPSPPRRPLGPAAKSLAGGEGAPLVGNGTDWSAQTTSAITSATGTFPVVSGVSSEISDGGVNGYSLQINTNVFGSTACAGGLPGCKAAMRVVFYGQSGNADIWYVLVPYYQGTTVNCPSAAWQGLAGNCYLEESKYQLNIGAQPVTNLQNLSLSAVAGNPNITMTISAGGTTAKSIGVPNFIGVGSGWTDAEFNIFGDGNGDTANIFSSGSGATIQVQTEVGTSSGSSNPSCVNTGSTGPATVETNNLNLVANCCAAEASAITFLESDVPGQSCVLCQGGNCLGANPGAISAAQGNGGAVSVNDATTQLTLSGAWASSPTAPTFTFRGMPAGVSCTATYDYPPSWGPSTITCTTSDNTLLGTYPITVTATIGSATASTNVNLTVTPCQPLTCSGIGYVCGSLADGCGNTENCGSCPSGETCTAGACYKCAERTCPPPEFFNLDTCECQACPCGTIHIDGHYICNVCRP